MVTMIRTDIPAIPLDRPTTVACFGAAPPVATPLGAGPFFTAGAGLHADAHRSGQLVRSLLIRFQLVHQHQEQRMRLARQVIHRLAGQQPAQLFVTLTILENTLTALAYGALIESTEGGVDGARVVEHQVAAGVVVGAAHWRVDIAALWNCFQEVLGIQVAVSVNDAFSTGDGTIGPVLHADGTVGTEGSTLRAVTV